MVIFLELRASNEDEKIITSALKNKIHELGLDRKIIYLIQIIKSGEKPYFSIRDGNKEIYQQEEVRRFNVSKLNLEIDRIVEFINRYNKR